MGEGAATGASACLGNDEVLRYVATELDPQEAERAEAHFDECSACRRLVAALANTSLLDVESADGAGSTWPDELIVRGATVGRYVLKDKLGAGAMGVVYRARDPKLRRDVAIKVLRLESQARSSDHARFLREAQSLARLSHPNVVPVYDVGDHAGRVFIAMELIEGTTLRGWLAAQSREPRKILEVLRGAAAGLAGAHRAGMVHRDFKPDNVLIADDGRVLVSDFGLVAFRGDTPNTPSPSPRGDDRLSATGAMIGTPAYMAPEQIRGEPAEPAADLFAWCVTAFEALVGRRPFGGDSPHARLREIEAQRIDPAIRTLPHRIRAALRRGLDPDPQRRFSTLDDLLAATAPVRGRVPAVLAVAGALAVGGTALALWIVEDDSTPARSEPMALDSQAAALLVEGDAAEDEERVGDAADAYVRAYAAAVSVGDWALATDAATSAFNLYGWRITDDAEAARWLRHAEAALSRHGPDPTREERLAYLTAEMHSGRGEYAKAEAALTIVLKKRLARFGDVDTRVSHAWSLLGSAQLRRGDLQQGLESHRRALLAAPPEAPPKVRGETLITYAAGLIDAGELVAAYEALVEARGLLRDASPRMRGHAAHNLAISELMLGKLDDAAAHFAEAREILSVSYGPDHPALNKLLLGSSRLHAMQGKLDACQTDLEYALNLVERNLGLTHPELVPILTDLAWTCHARGDSTTAERHTARALDISLTSQDPADVQVASLQERLALYRVATGKLDEAERLVADAHRRRRLSVGPDDPSLSLGLTARGHLQLARGTRPEAEQAAARALELADDPANRAEALLLQAELLRARGKRRRAVREARRARAEVEGRMEAGHVAADIERWLDDHGRSG